MRIAFKEWAIVVDALGRGDQIIILRKGGIAEGRGGFKVEHPEFLLFPTLFHQQRESVIPTAQERFDEISPSFPGTDIVRIDYFAKIVEWTEVGSIEALENFRGQHIWRNEVLQERFDWGRNKNIFALVVRVFQLPQTVELPMLPGYGGCKSWIELETEIATENARPVIDDRQFEQKLARLRHSLQLTPGNFATKLT